MRAYQDNHEMAETKRWLKSMGEKQLNVNGGIGREKRWRQHLTYDRTKFGIGKEHWKERAKIPAE